MPQLFRKSLWAIAFLVLPCPAASGKDVEFPEPRLGEIEGFLKKHCAKCHAASEPQAGIRLDTLPFAITTVEDTERWQKVLAALQSGSMPPDDEPQPGPKEKTEFLAVLSATLAEARRAIGDQGRIAALRRLNRRGYSHAPMNGTRLYYQGSPAKGSPLSAC